MMKCTVIIKYNLRNNYDLSNSDDINVINNLNKESDKLISVIINTLDNLAPKIEIVIKNKEKPWFTREIKNEIKTLCISPQLPIFNKIEPSGFSFVKSYFKFCKNL